jgi:hypothetical protein
MNTKERERLNSETTKLNMKTKNEKLNPHHISYLGQQGRNEDAVRVVCHGCLVPDRRRHLARQPGGQTMHNNNNNNNNNNSNNNNYNNYNNYNYNYNRNTEEEEEEERVTICVTWF